MEFQRKLHRKIALRGLYEITGKLFFRTHFLYRYTYFYEEWMKFMKFEMLPKMIQRRPNMNLKKGVRTLSCKISGCKSLISRYKTLAYTNSILCGYTLWAGRTFIVAPLVWGVHWISSPSSNCKCRVETFSWDLACGVTLLSALRERDTSWCPL